jgi:hypothetical protein
MFSIEGGWVNGYHQVVSNWINEGVASHVFEKKLNEAPHKTLWYLSALGIH